MNGTLTLSSLLAPDVLACLTPRMHDQQDNALPGSLEPTQWLHLDPSISDRARVSFAIGTDVPALAQLETDVWPEPLRSPPPRLAHRIANDPQGQIVLRIDGRIIGAIYTQRVDDPDALYGVAAADFSDLHRSGARVAQLLGVCVDPGYSGLGIGELLVQLSLRLARADDAVERIIGVTLCRDFAASQDADIESYVGRRDEAGLPADPILRFHVARGAKILAVLPRAYRGYYDGGEAGVLIEYPRFTRDGAENDHGCLGEAEAIAAVETALLDVLGPKRRSAYARDRSLNSMGLDSLDLHSLGAVLGGRIERRIDPTFFFRHPTAAEIVAGLIAPERSRSSGEQSEKAAVQDTDTVVHMLDASFDKLEPERDQTRGRVAIIGMACRFPGNVDSPEAFWELLEEGRDAIAPIPQSRWDAAAFHGDPARPGGIASRLGGFLNGIEDFDPGFFGMSPREASATDPQQRLLLEVTWEALERAGIDPGSLRETNTSVVMGVSGHDYERLAATASDPAQIGGHYGTGNAASIASGRLAYILGLQGPAITIDTACSSGLVALHLAAQAILNDECRLALAGAVNLILSPELSIAYTQANMLAPDGHCKTFSAGADGYVRSEGCAVVALKRLDMALADGNPILAVIEGSAINNDGPSNGLTAPNGVAQAAVIRQALAVAGVEPASVGYVEAHGTGTALGDPVEIEAIGEVYGQDRAASNPLIIGSVKANIGHTETAAGLAGLIKAILVLEHSQIPPQLHCDTLNPLLKLDRIPALIPTTLRDWSNDRAQNVRCASVSSFGFSGTNAHVILSRPDAAPARQRESKSDHRLLTLSARSPEALRQLAAAYRDNLCNLETGDLHDIVHTAATGRASFPYRLAVLGRSPSALHQGLQRFLTDEPDADIVTGQASGSAPTVAFLFTGQGSQFPGMAVQICREHPVARATIQECSRLFARFLDRSLEDILDEAQDQPSLLDAMSYAQPALFAVELALARTWIDCGIQPAAVIGHSLGEITAACVAGVIDLCDAVELVSMRGRFMEATPPGSMAVVFADADAVDRRLAGSDAVIGAYNAPHNTVISGPEEAVDEMLDTFAREGVEVRKLGISRASHSPLMDPMLEPFAAVCRQFSPKLPDVPMISNVTGEWMGEEILDPEYWVRHIREPVRFIDGVQTLAQAGIELFLEIGPRPVLTGLAQDCLPELPQGNFLPSLLPAEPNWQTLLRAAGAMFVRGAPLQLDKLDNGTVRRKVVLPTSPFERIRCWLPPLERQAPLSDALHGSRLDLAINAMVFSTRLGTSDRPKLAGHRVQGREILPAAATITMVVGASLESGRSYPVALSDIAFRRPFLLSHKADAQIVLDKGDGATRAYLMAKPDGTQDWCVHAEAEIGTQRTPPNRISESWERASTRITDVHPAGVFYETLRVKGLELGKEFRAIETLRIGPGEALGVTGNFRSDAQPAWLLPTVALNAAFLVAQAALPANTALVVPASIDHFVIFSSLPNKIACHVALRSERPDDHSFVADIGIFDLAGTPVAEMRGVLLREARPAQANSAIYELEWIDLPEDATSILAKLDNRACQLARSAISSLTSEEIDAIAHERNHRSRLLAHLKALTSEPARGIAHVAGMMPEKFGRAHAEFTLLEQCGGALCDVLRGTREPLDALAPDGDMTGLERLYRESMSFDAAQSGLAQAVMDLISRRTDTRPARILEIGAGTGATTSRVLAGLADIPHNYVFTDVSPALLRRAAPKFPNDITFDLLDIERDPLSQGFEQDFDIVIAANVLHATVDIEQTVMHATSLLAEGGSLVLLEGTGQRAWIDVVFGQLPGWWRFNDSWRGQYPLLDGNSWRHLLAKQGLTTRVIELSTSEALFPQAVIVATRGGEEAVRSEHPARDWLVFGGTPDENRAMAIRLQAKGERCGIADESAGSIWSAEHKYTDLIDLTCFSTEIGDDSVARLRAVGPAALALAQELAASSGKDTRVVQVTRGALATSPLEGARIDAAALGGLWQVLAREHPHVTLQKIDLDANAVDMEMLTSLLIDHEPITRARETVVALRGGRTLVPRLRSSSPVAWPPALAEGTHLVTGGLGGIGRAIVEWLVSHGAKSIVVAGRSIPDAQGERWAETMRQRGVQLEIHQADIASRQDVAAMLSDIQSRIAPLSGIFHCAGIHDDQLIEGQSWERIDRVLAGKLYGAWHLHELTQSLPLSHFVLFSSALGLLGAPGVAGYVAANAGLDALAHARRASGLPAVSIGWGPWQDTGMAADRQNEPAEWDRQGLRAMNPGDCLAALDALWGSDKAHVAVMAVDWPRLRRAFGQVVPASIEAFGLDTSAQPACRADPEQPKLVDQMRALSKRRQKDALADHLADVVATVLGVAPGTQIDRGQGFFALGMDSLTTLDLRNRIQSSLGYRLEQTALFRYSTIESLVNYLCQQLFTNSTIEAAS